VADRTRDRGPPFVEVVREPSSALAQRVRGILREGGESSRDELLSREPGRRKPSVLIRNGYRSRFAKRAEDELEQTAAEVIVVDEAVGDSVTGG
jgi:hypothetical protein